MNKGAPLLVSLLVVEVSSIRSLLKLKLACLASPRNSELVNKGVPLFRLVSLLAVDVSGGVRSLLKLSLGIK